ncbi:MAG: aminotransferase class I/II-fold pyridoxal phosphate-dependent enzyme [Alphaproteobacteria bacterium]|nr:aminotransferase class I/II-fold pyridoxal phosphate-dependent enzyme [Alphaproteobacteria bacterium]
MIHNSSLISSISLEAIGVPGSGILEALTYGWGRPGLIPLWAGEGDMSTPSFISDATTRSLAAGETFYTPNRGIPAFREAIARYMSALYETTFSPDRFLCTIGGMHAMQIAMRLALSKGDELLVPSPAWPNFNGAAMAIGAVPVDVPMGLTGENRKGRWFLDLDRLAQAVTPKTKAIVINSPSNPTGWTTTLQELKDVLSLARRHGLWIIADEIYAQFVFGGTKRAPSFHDVMDDDDRILFVQTFSKNWAMTGWRIGWLECHPSLAQAAENLIQYSSSGVPTFLQRGAIAAIDHGKNFIEHQIARAHEGRKIVCDALGKLPQLSFMIPEGAFYLYFKVEGTSDSMSLAKSLIDRANVGLAPGTAFTKSQDPWLRLCFLRKPDDLKVAVDRLSTAFSG